MSFTTPSPRTQKKLTGNLHITGSAVVCCEAQLVGNVTIGARTVVHPAATIIAEGGPIIIGEGNLFMERCTIINRKTENSNDEREMVIGDGNVFEFDTICESYSVGNDNVFEAKSIIGSSCTVTNHCVIGSGCSLTSREIVPANTIICGSEQRRHTRSTPLSTSVTQQLDYLIKLLPNFHKLVKSN